MPPSVTDRTSRLALLYRISQTLNSSLALDEVLYRMLDEVIQALNAERAFLMLRDQKNSLVFRAARGMDQKTINDPSFQISRSIVERVVKEGKAVLTSDALEDARFNTQMSVVTLRLRSILCVPIRHKEQMIGLIYVDNRLQTGMFTSEDLELLTAISSSAAIAIENAKLFENLQQSKQILEIAYDSTLEGWARALELRDRETEGHTRRVTDLTVRLAQALGLNGEELVQIYRGSLLHDIGKMGIPDEILRKPGPLTNEERDTMRLHTIYAREMLSKIQFLKDMLVIPYYHHEKWDGSGYPNGISGEQIPLPARIFAVVDVWDALISDRPYRSRWSIAEAKAYLLEEAGKHFDAKIVKVFLEMIDHDPEFSGK